MPNCRLLSLLPCFSFCMINMAFPYDNPHINPISYPLSESRFTTRVSHRIWETTKFSSGLSIFMLLMVFLVTNCLKVQAGRVAKWKPSGKIRGEKPHPNKCNRKNKSECCVESRLYTTYNCSSPVSHYTKAVLTRNSFEKEADGGGPSDDTPIVALSTGWFSKLARCFHNITIRGNGHRVVAMVVDDCDLRMECDDEHDYQPPCDNNIVDASKAVWKALGVPEKGWGGLDITWSDA